MYKCNISPDSEGVNCILDNLRREAASDCMSSIDEYLSSGYPKKGDKPRCIKYVPQLSQQSYQIQIKLSK